MSAYLVATCNPATPQLDAALMARITAAAGDAGLAPGDARILSEDVAAEWPIDACDMPRLARVRASLEHASIDLNVTPAARRRKRLLIADMDSTIIGQECIDELAEFVGKRDEIAAITERAMRGELDFEEALRERVGMLAGLPLGKLEEAFRDRISLTPGATTLTATMRDHGAFAALVSGGFTFFTERVAAAVGFDANQANVLIAENNALTGDVADPILGREAKAKALGEFLNARELNPIDALAVGDGANDLAMIDKAGLGVAFRAKPAVAEAADCSIQHGDLTALLYLQGYTDDEIRRP